MRREALHPVLTRIYFAVLIIWVILIVPSVLWWSNSVPWLVFMSVWANVAASAATWQASKAGKES